MPDIFDTGNVAVRTLRDLLGSIAGAAQIKVASGATVEAAIAGRLAAASNLSDLASSGAALANLGLLNLANVVTVTGAQTLPLSALGSRVTAADSGTPANYTLTLPGAAPAGSLIFVDVSSGFTKLLTLNGNDVGIDGLANRVLWRGEYVLLLRESGNWKKIGGRSIPFRGWARRTSTQAITAATITRVDFDTPAGDSTGLNLWWDAVNKRINPPRPGHYQLTFNAILQASASITHAEFGIQQVSNDVTAAAFSTSGSPNSLTDVANVVASGMRIGNSTSYTASANAVGGWHGVIRTTGGAGTVDYAAGILETNLVMAEIPIW